MRQRIPEDEIDARTLYEDVYCARGEMENKIKEQQLFLFADRTSTHWMRSNQVRLYFSSIAYLLLSALRRVGLAGTEMAKAQCDTIRSKLLKIGARIRVTFRRIWVSFASGCPYAAIFAAAFDNLGRAPPAGRHQKQEHALSAASIDVPRPSTSDSTRRKRAREGSRNSPRVHQGQTRCRMSCVSNGDSIELASTSIR